MSTFCAPNNPFTMNSISDSKLSDSKLSDSKVDDFLQNLQEYQTFYNLFLSFKDEEFANDRRAIILENIVYQMLNLEKEYVEKEFWRK
jgi:hypothetical protein